MYPAELVKPMRDQLAQVGFDELYSADAVDAALSQPGTTLVVVNSVCGCAAANARPGAAAAQNGGRPARAARAFLLPQDANGWTQIPNSNTALPQMSAQMRVPLISLLQRRRLLSAK